MERVISRSGRPLITGSVQNPAISDRFRTQPVILVRCAGSVAEGGVQHADELADPAAAVGRLRKAVEHVDDGW
jgi:hypothetical protein